MTIESIFCPSQCFTNDGNEMQPHAGVKRLSQIIRNSIYCYRRLAEMVTICKIDFINYIWLREFAFLTF